MEKISFFSKAIVDKTRETKKFILDDMLYEQFINIMILRYKDFKDFKNKIDNIVKRNTENHDKIHIEDKINNLCGMLSKEFHQPNYKNSLKMHDGLPVSKLPEISIISEDKNSLKMPDGLPVSKRMDTIGRMDTIQKATQYDSTVFSALHLPDNQSTIQWTSDINDAYILCAYMKSRINQDNNVAPVNRKFSIVLIVDKYTPYNRFINTQSITTTETINQKEKKETNCEERCIYPPSEEYTNDTHIECEKSTDKKACYSKFPSVTFTEIILLTRYFGMDCYHLDNYNSGSGEYYDLYFFSIKDCQNPKNNSMIDAINNFNKNNKPLKLTQVKVLPESQYIPFNCKTNNYKSKYLKYKSKYLALKNKMHEKHDTK
jgi:hypothetical protein